MWKKSEIGTVVRRPRNVNGVNLQFTKWAKDWLCEGFFTSWPRQNVSGCNVQMLTTHKNAEQLIYRTLHVVHTCLRAARHTHPSECQCMCVACALMGIISMASDWLIFTKYLAALLSDSSLRCSPSLNPLLLLKQKPNDFKSNCLVFHLCLINTQTLPSNHFKKVRIVW